MLYNKQVPIEQSALLVIDVQDSFLPLPRWPRRNNPQFEKNITRLIDAYRAAALPVFYVLHSDEDPGWEKTSPHYRLMSFLSPSTEEPVLHKITRNVFTSTNLAELLLEKDVRRVVITGIQTEQCCETSARVAADLGYAVDFVTEATMTFPIAHPDDLTKELGTNAIVERTEYALRDRFAKIRTVADLEKELQGAKSLAHAG